jgi:hypothetical protein
LNELDQLYYGTVEQVLPPGHALNVSKYQYEYIVLATCDLYSQMQCRCIRLDPYGSFNNFEDHTFEVGARVFVLFPRGNRTVGVILGGSRFYGPATDVSLGYHLKNRFNEIEQTYTKDGSWELESDDGPRMAVRKDRIEIDDSEGESIVLDKAAKRIEVKCKDWDVQVEGGCSITVKGAATIKAQSADVQVEAECTVKAAEIKAEASGNVEIKAGGKAKVDGSSIELNGFLGQVMTTGPAGSQPRCYVTGIPFVGLPKVKAG